MLIGTVGALWRYPVKSLAPESLATVVVEPDGFAGDRAGALIVRDADHARSGKPLRGKEHHLLHTLVTADAAIVTARDAVAKLEFVSGERYFDAAPISVIWDSWLNDVEALVGRPLDPLRYRPNLFAHAAPGFTEREAELVGATLGVGDTVLQVVATIKRCVTTTYDVATGERDPAVLREVAQRRSNVVGIYCTVERPGTISLGDAIRR